MPSEWADITRWRRKLFIYRMTVNQGTTRWFHLSVDFSIIHARDRVIAEYELMNWAASPHTIRAEGKLVDDRFICTFRDLGGEEQCCVYLFPSFTAGQNKPRCGICLHETWESDAPDCLSRAIAHDAPVLNWEEGGLVDEETGALLDDFWEAEFLTTHLTLERSGHKV